MAHADTRSERINQIRGDPENIHPFFDHLVGFVRELLALAYPYGGQGGEGRMAATENITVLFTDLVGSTELASTLTPDAADQVRRKHFSALRRAIAASGGTEVKNLGDGLMVVFPAASTALACAVAMQQAVNRDYAGAERALELRVGLSAGEATREADDYFGDPVIEAARLCARAEAGQILVADLVRANAGRRIPHPFSSLGELELKGIPEPVETLEVSWEPLGDAETAAPVPLPTHLEIVPLTGMVARDTEAELLADALKRVAAGAGREVALVSGDPGLGKTTLVAEAARRGFGAGACVLLGRCEEDLSASYAPFAEALHHYVAHAPEEVLTAHVAGYGGELARMVPALAQRLGGALPAPTSTDPETERYLLYGAVVGLLKLASFNQPLVLVLDDLQWSDKPSLQLLRHVVANIESECLLVLGTFRDSELSGSHPLTEVLGALRRESKVSRIDLKGFDDTGVLAFMEAAAGQRLDDDGVGLAHALYRETDGNPFFVGVVLLNLIETGAICQDDTGRWMAAGDLSEIALPSSVREVISARVARLGERAGRALTLGAVIGRDFDFDLLAAVTEFDQDELLDILDAAAAATLVREVSDVSGRWSFSHALTQHTLYQDLGATRRARAHRRVAEALEELYGENAAERVGELAHHWSNATQPVDTAKAISYARRAGEAALAALAPDDAVRFFSQALEFFGQQRNSDPLLGVDLSLGLGEAYRQAGIAAFRETFLDAARRAQELGATDRLVQAALANTRGFFSSGGAIDTEKVTVLEAALAVLAHDDSPERALLLATLCSELSFGPLEQRQALAHEAKDLARRLGDPASVIRVLNLVTLPLMVPSGLAERVADSSEALALAEALGDPELLFHAVTFRRITAVQAGDFEVAARCLDTMRTSSDRLRQPVMMWITAFFEAADAILTGDLERAEQIATSALQLGTDSGQPDAFSFYGGQLSRIRVQQGRAGEMVSLIEQVVTDNPGLPAFQAGLALTQLHAGDDAKALELLQAAAADEFASLPLDFLWMTTVALYARAAVELRASGPAQQLYGLLGPYRGQVPFIGSVPECSTAFHLGALASVLHRYEEAEAYFIEATELNRRGQLKYDAANTHLEWGLMLADRREPGDLDRALALLEQVRSDSATHGYAMIERQAVAALSNLI